MEDVGLQYFKAVCDDEVGLALPLGAVGCAAPAMSVTPGFQVLVESEVI